MLNRVELIGRLGRDVEYRTMNSGDQVANFSLAVSEKYKDRDGQKQEKTEWISCVCFDERINKILRQYVKKGDLIRFVGRFQTRKWQDNQGIDKYKTEVVGQKFRTELTLLGGGNSQNQSNQDGGFPQKTNDQGGFSNNDLDDEIPF